MALNTPESQRFWIGLGPQGFLRHWLVAGPHEVPYEGPPGDENELRRSMLDRSRVEPPPPAVLNANGPWDQRWRFKYPGENIYLEHSDFYFRPTLIDSWAATEIESPVDGVHEAQLWAAGAVDLWINGEHINRFDVPRYMNCDHRRITLALRKGVNRVCARLQCFGVRDTRILLGLQFADPTGLRVRVPGADRVVECSVWLDGVRTNSRNALVATTAAPANVEVISADDQRFNWSQGSSSFVPPCEPPFQLAVEVRAQEQLLSRRLEIPANRGEPTHMRERADWLEYISDSFTLMKPPLKGLHCHLALLAGRLLGRHSPMDGEAFSATTTFVDSRGDCADFVLATLLRLDALKLTTPAESAQIKRTALAFRYWSDEPGNDAMCFWSENHSFLFHGCQLIAGRLYSEGRFSNSDRSGVEQSVLGAQRCREWLDRTEARGFEEYNSSTYMPITIAALLNVVDFSGDAELSGRAAKLIDGLYEKLALHAFRGTIATPQGRVYRSVLYPEESGTQALLAHAMPQTPIFLPHPTSAGVGWGGSWLVFPCSSPCYRPPAHLAALASEPASRRYREHDVEIVLHKTADYLLTSLAIPLTSADSAEPIGLAAGGAGYQQHVWQATLGAGCHVFVNHPGCSFDESKSRPGYWYGNGVLPRLRQRDGILSAIYKIPDGTEPAPDLAGATWISMFSGRAMPFDLYPIPFTHAHWPADAFDREVRHDHWVFGQKDDGLIGLWCSEPLRPAHDVLTDRELRASGYRSAWVAICGSITDHGSLDSFVEACQHREPAFDAESMVLQMNGEEPLGWTS